MRRTTSEMYAPSPYFDEKQGVESFKTNRLDCEKIAGNLFKQTWLHPVIIGVAAFSSILYILFWDGTLHRLDNQGAIGILINAAILAVVLIWNPTL